MPPHPDAPLPLRSNPQQVRQVHVGLALDVDFRLCILSGTIEFTAEVLQDGAASFDLDTRDLKIKGATVEGKSVKCSFAKPHEALGTRLSIPLDASLRTKGKKLTLHSQVYFWKGLFILCLSSSFAFWRQQHSFYLWCSAPVSHATSAN